MDCYLCGHKFAWSNARKLKIRRKAGAGGAAEGADGQAAKKKRPKKPKQPRLEEEGERQLVVMGEGAVMAHRIITRSQEAQIVQRVLDSAGVLPVHESFT